jgi:hypothetical protein
MNARSKAWHSDCRVSGNPHVGIATVDGSHIAGALSAGEAIIRVVLAYGPARS